MAGNNFVSPFYTHDALAVTAKFFSFVKDNIGEDILPVVIGSRYCLFKTIELVGNQYADYRTVLNHGANLKRILKLHEETYKRYIIELGGISELDCSRHYIDRWIAENDLMFIKKSLSRAPYLCIDCSWDEFKGRKKRKFWYNISRSQKLLEGRGGTLTFKIMDSVSEISEALDRCMALYEENWNRLTSSSLFITHKGKQFLKDLLVRFSSKNNSEICTIEQNENLLAFSIGLKFDSTYYFYIFATTKKSIYSTYSVGKIHLSYVLESVFNRGFKVFDFMAGEESYKNEWTKSSNAITTYYVVSKTPLNMAIMSVFNLLDMLFVYLKSQKMVRSIFKKISLLKK